MSATDNDAADAPPAVLVRIISGDPTAEELAATHAVIAAAMAEQAALGAQRRIAKVDLWRRSARAPRTTLQAGPGAWNASRNQRG